MSKLIFDLKSLLVPSAAVVQGTVVEVALDLIYLSSPTGPKQFRVANPGTYRKGDKVRFQGEVFLGKVADEALLPYHSV